MELRCQKYDVSDSTHCVYKYEEFEKSAPAMNKKIVNECIQDAYQIALPVLGNMKKVVQHPAWCQVYRCRIGYFLLLDIYFENSIIQPLESWDDIQQKYGWAPTIKSS